MNKVMVAASHLPMVVAPIGAAELLDPGLETAVPGFDHVSSVALSFGVADLTVLSCEYVADRLEARARPVAAERLKRAAGALAWAGSIAAQAVAEGGYFAGKDDWRDVLLGLAATVPGIIAGRAQAGWVRKHGS
jgi:hypothetical protein